MLFVNRESAKISGEDISFSFGQNWKKFLSVLNEDRIVSACISIKDLTGLGHLTGLSFLDAGCGSGLFSLAAARLGAKQVISIDIDPFSVECAKYLRSREGLPSNWIILEGTVLSTPFRENSFDMVYSWGVVHHTGAMWKAINHLSTLVACGGYFYVAIYLEGRFSAQWLRVKRFYNRQNRAVKKLMVFAMVLFSLAMAILHRRNPLREITDYGRKSRGMSWLRDIEDWLGGLPYEYAKPEVVKEFLTERGFELVRRNGMEYLFVRKT